MIGSTSFVISARPKTLISNMRLTSSSSLSSTAPKYPMPALFTKTSIRPNACMACCTLALIAVLSVTSSSTEIEVSGYASTISLMSLVLREVTTTLFPCCSARVANSLPKPVEHPVMNQTLFIKYVLIVKGTGVKKSFPAK